ncbi:MAG: chemotaxis protein CheW [Oscillospiraceae bacterium]|jgi:chemotaxis signal transduction protein
MEWMHQDKLVETEELPHLVFKVKDNYYAIDSKHISSIMQYQGSEKLPNSPPEMMGIVIFREKAAPILDLRSIFRLPTLEQEYQQFVEMIEQRKADHIHWVTELERSVETGEKFKLTTDPHQCAFGRWYDAFHINNNSVMFHLAKIRDPHDNLHQAAVRVLQCKEENSTQEAQEACQANVMFELKEKYMPTVLGLLEEAKEIFKSTYKEMVIMVGEENPVGLMVDEVISVEYLEKGDTLDALGSIRSEVLTRTMRSKRNSNIIYLLDEQKLLGQYQVALA